MRTSEVQEKKRWNIISIRQPATPNGMSSKSRKYFFFLSGRSDFIYRPQITTQMVFFLCVGLTSSAPAPARNININIDVLNEEKWSGGVVRRIFSAPLCVFLCAVWLLSTANASIFYIFSFTLWIYLYLKHFIAVNFNMHDFSLIKSAQLSRRKVVFHLFIYFFSMLFGMYLVLQKQKTKTTSTLTQLVSIFGIAEKMQQNKMRWEYFHRWLFFVVGDSKWLRERSKITEVI